ncbi:MAG: thiamine diphosphokinase [Ignavibacteriaceae bacterium]
MSPKIKNCIIIGSGEIPAKKAVDFFVRKSGHPVIISADGGTANALKLKLLPDFVIGDFDSVSEDQLKMLPKETKLIRIERQSDSDIEKCIEYASSEGCSDFLLLGVTGKRIDHTLGNISILLRNSEVRKMRIVTPDSVVEVIREKTEIATEPGERISLFSFNVKTEITTEGLLYPLKREKLIFGKREGTSNEATGNIVVITAVKGDLLLIRDLKAIIRHG